MPSAPEGAHVVILAGGEGTRLWPLSRSRRPKQLLSLAGQRSLIQQTVDRVLPLLPPERILVVTERTHAADLRAQLPALPAESIDTGIMERADNVATIPATFRWTDIGSWAELWEVSERDARGNVVRGGGRLLQADSRDNLVYAEGRAVALVGAHDLVVIETSDAVFVCPRDRALDVKLIVQQLQQAGATELL